MENTITTSIKRIIWLILIIVIIAIIYIFKTFVSPPTDFPSPYQLNIESGQTLFSISHELTADHVIRSPRIFEMFMIGFGSEKSISEGEYYFASPLSSLQIALRISTHSFGISKVKVTFPEGFTSKQMKNRLIQTFPEIDGLAFETLTKGKEGYLFPDTYSFFPNVSVELVVEALEKNFDKKIAPVVSDITGSRHSLKDIITMASIIEKEASGENDRAVISGILWKRLSLGLPLQVDAPFLYISGKDKVSSFDLSLNSAYNTYTHTGLPPTPIGNPGFAAIVASIHPEESPYLYYLHGTDRNIHYAVTYTEHQANIKKYLK